MRFWNVMFSTITSFNANCQYFIQNWPSRKNWNPSKATFSRSDCVILPNKWQKIASWISSTGCSVPCKEIPHQNIKNFRTLCEMFTVLPETKLNDLLPWSYISEHENICTKKKSGSFRSKYWNPQRNNSSKSNNGTSFTGVAEKRVIVKITIINSNSVFK